MLARLCIKKRFPYAQDMAQSSYLVRLELRFTDGTELLFPARQLSHAHDTDFDGFGNGRIPVIAQRGRRLLKQGQLHISFPGSSGPSDVQNPAHHALGLQTVADREAHQGFAEPRAPTTQPNNDVSWLSSHATVCCVICQPAVMFSCLCQLLQVLCDAAPPGDVRELRNERAEVSQILAGPLRSQRARVALAQVIEDIDAEEARISRLAPGVVGARIGSPSNESVDTEGVGGGGGGGGEAIVIGGDDGRVAAQGWARRAAADAEAKAASNAPGSLSHGGFQNSRTTTFHYCHLFNDCFMWSNVCCVWSVVMRNYICIM